MKKQGAKGKGVALGKTSTPCLGDRLVSGLREIAEALQSGEPLEKRFTVRTLQLDLEPKAYGPGDVKAA